MKQTRSAPHCRSTIIPGLELKTGSSNLLVVIPLLVAAWFAAAPAAWSGPEDVVRIWTDVEGREIEARAARMEGDVVVLVVGQREFRVPKERLSRADHFWLMREGRRLPRHRVIGEDKLKPLAEEQRRRMVSVPGEPTREWDLGPGRSMTGRLIGVVGRDLVIQPAGRDQAMLMVWPPLGHDQAYFHRVSPPQGELAAFPGAGAAAAELAEMGLEGYEYRKQRYLANPAPAGVRSSIRFRWFTPELDPGRQYPLVVFLHGIGELGEDNVRQLAHRDPLVLVAPENQRRSPCFFMAPQHAAGEDWGGGGSYQTPNAVMRATLEAMRYMQLVQHAERIDWRRIYVTGLSSGGHGAYAAIGLYPEWFAAAVPVSASSDPARFRRDNARPMWVFYNRGDSPRLAHNIGLMERHLRQLGQPLRVTVFDGGGHNAWRDAYDHGGLARWLFNQQQPLR